MTRIVIAHRPETIASAERVLALTNGELHTLPAKTHASAERDADMTLAASVVG